MTPAEPLNTKVKNVVDFLDILWMQNSISVERDIDALPFIIFVQFMAAALAHKKEAMLFNEGDGFFCGHSGIFSRHILSRQAPLL